MKKQLLIKSPPFSINKLTYRDKRYKSAEAKEWTYDIVEELNKPGNVEAMKELREHFKASKHAYVVELTFFYPESIIFTQAGHMSAKAHDISNIEKPIIDVIFLPQYYQKKAPYGAPNLNIDDKYISDMTSKKRAADSHGIIVDIEIVSLSSINKVHTLSDFGF